MLGRAGGESFKIIAAFQSRDHAPAGVGLCDIADRLGDPAEILFEPVQVCERIARMGVEAGRDDTMITYSFLLTLGSTNTN